MGTSLERRFLSVIGRSVISSESQWTTKVACGVVPSWLRVIDAVDADFRRFDFSGYATNQELRFRFPALTDRANLCRA
jgi:hypothetical protein